MWPQTEIFSTILDGEALGGELLSVGQVLQPPDVGLAHFLVGGNGVGLAAVSAGSTTECCGVVVGQGVAGVPVLVQVDGVGDPNLQPLGHAHAHVRLGRVPAG